MTLLTERMPAAAAIAAAVIAAADDAAHTTGLPHPALGNPARSCASFLQVLLLSWEPPAAATAAAICVPV